MVFIKQVRNKMWPGPTWIFVKVGAVSFLASATGMTSLYLQNIQNVIHYIPILALRNHIYKAHHKPKLFCREEGNLEEWEFWKAKIFNLSRVPPHTLQLWLSQASLLHHSLPPPSECSAGFHPRTQNKLGTAVKPKTLLLSYRYVHVAFVISMLIHLATQMSKLRTLNKGILLKKVV